MFQSEGFDEIRAVPRPSRALKNASPCVMRMSNALDTGGGRHEETYEKRGLRNPGTGICRGSTTFAITDVQEVGRGGCKVQRVAGRGMPHTTNANT